MTTETNLIDRKLEAEIAKLMAETIKIMEESKKTTIEQRWYHLASAGLSAIIASLIVAVSKFVT
ncbi:MAG: hypothetical protein LBI62_03630 [Candidatus Accumulibacter sp.]|jgi:hypothetical protein|nr:hypothetical protein [Accumulibacter sp.]